MRRPLLMSSIVIAVLVDTAVSWTSCSSVPRAEDVAQLRKIALPLSLERPYARADYAFLDDAIGSASIVALGESLHITDELPRIRLRFIRHLHEDLGFDTLAFEGSLTQAWLAEDHLYRSGDGASEAVRRAQEMAWFTLWNTPSMAEVLAYANATQHTASPLYVTSFDMQTGSSAAFGNTEDVLAALFDTLRAYGPAPGADEAAWHSALATVVHCHADPAAFVARRADAMASIAAIDRWIGAIADRVAEQRPTAHVRALRLIPENLRQNVDLCTRAPRVDGEYQQIRDELAAENVITLRDRVSTTHKIILWAHHSHVGYDSTRKNVPSMGEHLHARFGRGVYTVGLFAGRGRFTAADLFGERELPSVRQVGVERMLAAVGDEPYFVDLRQLPSADPHAGWLVEQSSRLEALGRRPTVLAQDFDGAVYVPRVHPAELSSIPPAGRRLLRISGFFMQHMVGVAILVLTFVGWILWVTTRSVVRRIGRRRAPRVA